MGGGGGGGGGGEEIIHVHAQVTFKTSINSQRKH